RGEAGDFAQELIAGREAFGEAEGVHREQHEQQDRKLKGSAGGRRGGFAFAHPPLAIVTPLPVRSCSMISSSTARGGRTRSSGRVVSGWSSMRISSTKVS